MVGFLNCMQGLLDRTRALDFLGPLALRLYLVPIFWMSGTKKLENAGLDCLSSDGGCSFVPKQDIIDWFGNPDWGLGLPFPEVMAWLASYTEYFGAILLLIGLAVRWISVPLMFTMVVAAVTVHLPNGWLAIAEGSGSFFANERTIGAIERLNAAKGILQEHGNYEWLTANGSFVVLNNGIEFATTYFIMLLALFFIGSGKYFSFDYWIARKWRREGTC